MLAEFREMDSGKHIGPMELRPNHAVSPIKRLGTTYF